jgi:PTH1 family peptidyl-tRNA hydrolase
MDFYQVPLSDLLVVCDDINLPLGKLRVRARGTHGGHNGLRNIQEHLGTTEYARLRIGVDSPREGAVDHVLGRFKPSERPVIEDAVGLAAQAVVVWVKQGVEACMNRYNADKEPK